jgi:alkanesulfonate monooxygenase SsuD/methylene tetrahydromethanopterin reductase-like flavin-dependent oxidoreductase (luciferase family)
MTRGFGIDATVTLDAALEVAGLVEQAGYGSFWVNGSPHGAALDILEGALNTTSLDVGVGVFPLPQIPATELVAEVVGRDLPQDRIRLGVGSGRRPGALDEVRQGVAVLRDALGVEVVTGAVGPKMMALAGEVADAVVLTWSFVAEVERARPILEQAAAKAGRKAPPIVSFIRCALMPESAEALAERAAAYDAIPHYHEVFARNGITAADTVVQGTDRPELIRGIETEEAAVDVPVIRAITPDHTVESFARLIEACAP